MGNEKKISKEERKRKREGSEMSRRKGEGEKRK